MWFKNKEDEETFEEIEQRVKAEVEAEWRAEMLVQGYSLDENGELIDTRSYEQFRTQLDARLKKWSEENPEESAAIDLRIDNNRKYKDSGIYYEPLSKDYLHNHSYQQRLAKAEALNGCKFKDSPELNSKRWQKIDKVFYDKDTGFRNLCDGKIATMGRLNGFTTYTLVIQVPSCLFGLTSFFDGHAWTGILLPIFFSMFFVRKWLKPYDQFVFDRHLGLVKTPHNWWRRSFYIPPEDLECYDGGEIKSARGGGSRSTAKFRCMKTPKRFYLKTPEFISRFGGVDQGCWAGYLEFMDITIPINPQLHKSIEHYYTIDKNALETGPFPEEMKKYIDPDDKQVNREHVW